MKDQYWGLAADYYVKMIATNLLNNTYAVCPDSSYCITDFTKSIDNDNDVTIDILLEVRKNNVISQNNILFNCKENVEGCQKYSLIFVGKIMHADNDNMKNLNELCDCLNGNYATHVNSKIKNTMFNGYISFETNHNSLWYIGQLPIELKYLNDYQAMIMGLKISQFTVEFISCFNWLFISPFAHVISTGMV